MSGISNYFMDLVADNLSNRSEMPATIYIALVTAEPFMSSTGTSIVEPPNNVGYSRQAYTMDSSNWSQSSSGVINNTSPVIFSDNSYGIWGTVIAWVACSASSGGNVLFWGTLDAAVYINTGANVSVPVGGMTISVEPNSYTTSG